ncbi:hypothetical protein HGG76_11260 [Ochrobactrum tritici]|uniref:HEPN domain-containing protein n=1 Tax=Brucella tritici TaxID=94626 RepID=A0A7X6JAH2_9HYPH|nr:hypothetical protein [Brucella tritici]
MLITKQDDLLAQNLNPSGAPMQIDKDDEAALYEAFQRENDGGLITPAIGDVPSLEFSNDDAVHDCRIWEGYLDASILLLEKATQDWPRSNNLVFPGLFNLRHAMEVALKWLIKYAGGTVPKRAGHNLSVLIDAFRDTAVNLDEERTYISECFLERISEIAALDPVR